MHWVEQLSYKRKSMVNWNYPPSAILSRCLQYSYKHVSNLSLTQSWTRFILVNYLPWLYFPSLCFFFSRWDRNRSLFLTQVQKKKKKKKENLTDAASLLPFPRPNCQQCSCQLRPDKHRSVKLCRIQSGLSVFMHLASHYWELSRAAPPFWACTYPCMLIMILPFLIPDH